MQEVVNNLVQNAIEALASIKDGARILAVRTKKQPDNSMLLEVEDTGPGIDATTSAKIFDAFVTTKSRGTGLGLALCQTIVERHGGKISVVAAQTRGSIFRVVLPTQRIS